jgi:hypothetical protein
MSHKNELSFFLDKNKNVLHKLICLTNQIGTVTLKNRLVEQYNVLRYCLKLLP